MVKETPLHADDTLDAIKRRARKKRDDIGRIDRDRDLLLAALESTQQKLLSTQHQLYRHLPADQEPS